MIYIRISIILAGMIAFICFEPVLGTDFQKPAFAEYDSKIKPFFKKYCIRCHNLKKTEGDMRLDQVSSKITNSHEAEHWQEVLDVLNASEMPPEKQKQPNVNELADVIDSLTNGLFAARKRLVDSNHVTMRRLNRREYQNTIQSLLGVTIDTTSLPVDGKRDGFDTVGDAQYMSVIEFEKYLELGRISLDRALVSGDRPESKTVHLEAEDEVNEKAQRLIKRMAANIRQMDEKLKATNRKDETENYNRLRRKYIGMTKQTETYLKVPFTKTGVVLGIGEERFTVTLLAVKDQTGKSSNPKARRSRNPLPNYSGYYVARFKVGLTCKPNPNKSYFLESELTDTFSMQKSYTVPLGAFKVTALHTNPQIIEIPFYRSGEKQELLALSLSELNIVPGTSKRELRNTRYDPKKALFWIDSVEIEGPIFDQWPPTAFTNIFFKGIPQKSSSETAYAREIIERFTFKAFRHKSPDPEYLQKIHSLYLGYRKDGMSFTNAIKESLSIILASPSFVFIVEDQTTDQKGHRDLTDLELATRLSYFLWSSPPDKELYSLAEQGHLSLPSVLKTQVERMLDDPKSKQFITAFTSQWLELEWLDMIVVDTDNRFPEFNETLRRSYREETIAFMSELIKSDLSVTNMIDSDFVMIDDVLAKFYGINVKSEVGFRKVSLPKDSPRGGLLGQASILTMTSTGERTSPVERGVFIYSKLLGSSIPPPPPNVPQLVISSESKLTVRQTLEEHVKKAQCASCHRKMDPLGYALEYFDAIGNWRKQEAGSSTEKGKRGNAIISLDASGVMPDGKRSFDGHEALKKHLLADQDKLAAGLSKAMLTYALGRRVGFSDGIFVEQFIGVWKKDGYGMLIPLYKAKNFNKNNL